MITNTLLKHNRFYIISHSSNAFFRGGHEWHHTKKATIFLTSKIAEQIKETEKKVCGTSLFAEVVLISSLKSISSSISLRTYTK